jgi:hypothetical protein
MSGRMSSAPNLFGATATALVLLASGCSPNHSRPSGVAMSEGEFLPRPPSFLTGPIVVLLTNSTGFSARLTMASPSSSHTRAVSGQLIGRDARFFFEPEQAAGKQARAGRFSFIWDASKSGGYILSEALQGYAPIASDLRFTNLSTQSSQAAAEKVKGHPVDRTTVVVFGSDGTQSRLEVSRDLDLGGLPVRIDSLEAPVPATMTLTQIRLGVPAEKLFLPPEGFTKYPSEEAMMNELAARRQGAREAGPEPAGEERHAGSGRTRHSRGAPDPGP